jgi:hypothetical protein
MRTQEAPLPDPPAAFPALSLEERYRESLFRRTFPGDSYQPNQPGVAYSLSLKKLSLSPPNTMSPFQRGVRGGMLCDEPGLGKTITMLAVVLRSIGTRTEPEAGSSVSAPDLSERHGLRSPSSRRRSVSRSSLFPSQTTLIIAPDTLLSHWRDQINLHVSVSLRLKIFIDSDLSAPLAPAEEISKHDIFITTFRSVNPPPTPLLSSHGALCRRLSTEWRQGKPKCKLDEKRRQTFEEEFQGDEHVPVFLSPRKPTPAASAERVRHLSELLRVYWLRIVIDEGHQLGRSSTTNAIQMASLLEAERRWILTGTPTRSSASEATTTALRHLYQASPPLLDPLSSLLLPLRCSASCVTSRSLLPTARSSGRSLSPSPWSAKYRVGWPPQSPAPTPCSKSCRRFITSPLLRSFPSLPLRQIMIRHSKEGMASIPKPKWKKTLLEMSETERTSYNAIVALAQSNLVTTGL